MLHAKHSQHVPKMHLLDGEKALYSRYRSGTSTQDSRPTISDSIDKRQYSYYPQREPEGNGITPFHKPYHTPCKVTPPARLKDRPLFEGSTEVRRRRVPNPSHFRPTYFPGSISLSSTPKPPPTPSRVFKSKPRGQVYSEIQEVETRPVLPPRPGRPNTSPVNSDPTSTPITEFTDCQSSNSSANGIISPISSCDIHIGYHGVAEGPQANIKPECCRPSSTDLCPTQVPIETPLPPLPLQIQSQQKFTHQKFVKIDKHLKSNKNKHVFVARPISLPEKKKPEKVGIDLLRRSVDEIIEQGFSSQPVNWGEILESVKEEAYAWWNTVKSRSYISLEEHVCADMLASMPSHVQQAAKDLWYDFWSDDRVPTDQVSLTAVAYLYAFRRRSFLPKRIPPEIRCPESQIQSKGWALFQQSLAGPNTVIPTSYLLSMNSSQVAAFLELMLSKESMSKAIAVLNDLSAKDYFLDVDYSVLSNLLATLIMRLFPYVNDQDEIGNGLECLSRILKMVSQKTIGDKSSAIPVIFENVLCRLETHLVVFCFGIFLCLANQWPDTADVTQHKVLDRLRTRIRHETNARGIDGKRHIHTDILISVRVVLTLTSMYRRDELSLLFPIFHPTMEDLVGKTFRDMWDVLGLRKLYNNQVAAYMKAQDKGIGEMKKSARSNRKHSGGCRERRQDKELDRLLTGEVKRWGFLSFTF